MEAARGEQSLGCRSWTDFALNVGCVAGPGASHKLFTLWDLSLGFSKPGIMAPPAVLLHRLESMDVEGMSALARRQRPPGAPSLGASLAVERSG